MISAQSLNQTAVITVVTRLLARSRNGGEAASCYKVEHCECIKECFLSVQKMSTVTEAMNVLPTQ